MPSTGNRWKKEGWDWALNLKIEIEGDRGLSTLEIMDMDVDEPAKGTPFFNTLRLNCFRVVALLII